MPGTASRRDERAPKQSVSKAPAQTRSAAGADATARADGCSVARASARAARVTPQQAAKLRRMERNRLSAALSRERARAEAEQITADHASARARHAAARARVLALEADALSLRHEVHYLRAVARDADRLAQLAAAVRGMFAPSHGVARVCLHLVDSRVDVTACPTCAARADVAAPAQGSELVDAMHVCSRDAPVDGAPCARMDEARACEPECHAGCAWPCRTELRVEPSPELTDESSESHALDDACDMDMDTMFWADNVLASPLGGDFAAGADLEPHEPLWALDWCRNPHAPAAMHMRCAA